MAYKKGQSGNPSGRPKVLLPDGRALSDICKPHTEAAVQTLIDVMGDEEAPHPARVAAANALLDRGWGKPKQDLGLDVSDDLAAIIEAGRKRLADG